jgi:hypothetical protein
VLSSSPFFIRQSEEEAGFEMAVLQKKYVFFPVKGSKGSEGSKFLYSGIVLGS